MSGLNLVQIQDQIAAYIRQEFSGYEVIEDFVIDDDAMQRANNNTKPYIVLTWSGLGRSSRGANFAGVRFDEYYSGFQVSIIAPTPKQCRKSINVITDKLIGWSPNGSGNLVPSGGGGVYVASEKSGRPNLYVSSSSFSFPVNGQDVGAHIAP
jgi:hypothetical protein